MKLRQLRPDKMSVSHVQHPQRGWNARGDATQMRRPQLSQLPPAAEKGVGLREFGDYHWLWMRAGKISVTVHGIPWYSGWYQVATSSWH